MTVDSGTVTVRADVEPFPILPPPEPYTLRASIPALPAGSWQIELVPGLQWTGPPWETWLLEVLPRRVEIEPVVSPLIAGETARLRVAGQTRCGFDAGQLPLVDGDRILVEVPLDCAGPPQPFEAFVETPPLDAGSYRLLAVESSVGPGRARLFGDGELTVFPRPTLARGRFALDVAWRDFGATEGIGRPVTPPGPESALFWFFAPTNEELMVKVLDGCAINGHWWVFSAASTNVAYTLEIEDRETGETWSTSNPSGTPSPARTDTEAFSCRSPAPDSTLPVEVAR